MFSHTGFGQQLFEKAAHQAIIKGALKGIYNQVRHGIMLNINRESQIIVKVG